MHYLMLITLTMQASDTSGDARKRAQALLMEDPSFCGEGGRFYSPLCDWFVIGGRWSGLLQETLLGQAYQDAFKRDFPEMTSGWFPSDLAIKHRDSLNRLWQQFGGTGANPVTRSGSDELGREDDAMLVDQALYDQFLKEYHGEECRRESTDGGSFADLDHEEVAESFIGRKWLVVVDYHN